MMVAQWIFDLIQPKDMSWNQDTVGSNLPHSLNITIWRKVKDVP